MSSSYGRRPALHRKDQFYGNCQYTQSPYNNRRHNFQGNFRPDRPPGHPARTLRPNFIVHLLWDNGCVQNLDVDRLIDECKVTAEKFSVFSNGPFAASLFYRQWADALEAMVRLWKMCLHNDRCFTPRLISNITVPSDLDDLADRLKALFAERVRGSLEGEEVKGCKEKLKQISDEIVHISARLRKPNRIGVYNDLSEKKRGLLAESELIKKKLKEFDIAMKCILHYLEGVKGEVGEEEGTQVFRFDSNFDGAKVHCMIMRECNRLKDSLPIYAYRCNILSHVFQHQIMVLIGETGSGKSTQLVQFLADSGLAANGSIVCTQPRKIAATSLAHRVREECSGCYEDNSVVCFPAFASTQQFNSKIIFLTDHCLLQHYMNDTILSGISCIIVDEAHERSLNTDLLLTMVKDLLSRRHDLRLIIMSATADANQLSEYFFGCGIFHVEGRNFPVEIRYVPSANEGHSGTGAVAAYVSNVVRTTTEIHRTEKEGTILAFLTSQMEVEWACENFESRSAVALALHGKLSFDEQFRVFKNYPGKRKVIFATNVAETSLTIPGVKYVIDSGMVKESKFEPGTGMNVLKVCRISQSSANQRTGRAGRTEPGRCYRLYAECDFASMPSNQEPEIRRVHLGIAVLRILALGIKNIQDFDFIDAPCSEAIATAIRNLLQLGAVAVKNEVLELTRDGRDLVKMGIEPRLGKLILNCYAQKLKKEGVVLASVMANASSIFCRVGNDGNKLKSDSLKVPFCHRNGDLFTLLSVYKEWEALPREKRNGWCWENSINAKSMRRCQDTIQELEACLQKELSIIIPSYWVWSHNSTEHDKNLKKAILFSLAENAAMYSGCDQLGYEVALTGKHIQLHPSCSLHIFSQKPHWVVFSELLSISNQYLVCVTAFDFESLSTLCPPPLFNALEMERRKLEVQIMPGYGCILLKKFCGKSNSNLIFLVSRIRAVCKDTRITLEVNIDKNEIQVFATSKDMDNVISLVHDALELEKKWLRNECMEKCLFHGTGVSPVALFGAGAEIKRLELEKRCLTVDVFQSNGHTVDDKELLIFLERYASGSICTVHKFTSTAQDSNCREKWGRLTFLTPDAAEKAAGISELELGGSIINVTPSQETPGGDNRIFSFPAVKAKVCWPRRYSKGFAIVKCDINDVAYMVSDFSNLPIGGKYVRCEISTKSMDSVVLVGLDKELTEDEILEVLRRNTSRRIIDFFLVRGDAAENPPCKASEEALWKEICPYMPKRSLRGVQVFPPEPKDVFSKALITFDGRMHLEAARALEKIEGKVLPGCLSWQKIKCQQLFHSSLSCPAPVYFVINKELDSLLSSFKHLKGAECKLDRTLNGSYRVKISANATKTVAQLRRPLEELMRGRTIKDASFTPTVRQLLLSRDGIHLMRTLQRETGTHIFFDRHSQDVRIFGQSEKISVAQQRLIESLMTINESKQLEVHLRGGGLPPDLMKEVVEKFGPDLHGLKEKVPEAEFTLNTRHHMIIISGNKELKQKVEEIIYEVAQMSGDTTERPANGSTCTICLCDVEDGYQLEGCGHMFCRLCLVEQCESAMKNLDSFPICCTHEGCREPILMADLRSLLSSEKLEELFRASLGAFVASSIGKYRFCPSADCPSVYQVAEQGTAGEAFVCGACYTETCNRCHMEYHPHITCEKFREFKEDPDSSLIEWRKGKEHVKSCPECKSTIEKVDGCNHIECRCGHHICWACLEVYQTSDDCYTHLRNVHQALI